MIDVRRLRTDLAGVRAAMARRAQPELLAAARRGRRARSGAAGPDRPARRAAPADQRALEAGRPAARQRRRRRRRGGRWPRAGAWATPRPTSPARPTTSSATCATLLLRIPNVPAADAPDGKSEADNVVRRRPSATTPDALRRAPAGAALGDRRRARHPRHRAGGQDLRARCSRCCGASAPR